KLHIGMTVDGARVDIGFFGLRELIMTAYGVKQNQIMGPDWMSSQRFDISAKIPDGVSKDKVPEMLQTLLAERFGLKFHRESKEQAMFALVVAKGGSKMKEAEAEAAPVAVAPGAAPPPPPGPGQSFTVGTANGQASVRVAQNGNGGATMTMSGGGGRGGNIKMNMVDGMMRMEMSSISMPAFAEAITRFVDKPVVDQTELKGNYQIALDMTMADMMAVAKATMGGMGMAMGPEKPGGPGGAAGGAGEASDPAGGSIFSSVQKLGLRLEPKKSPVDILVVDHLEKNPGEN
ncbi:MAG TPA: TIGR03435 family protein, partial [Bryobacteraceae bacterium]|nr:TIGR03435 family protein [Bryobacteraceae bacterium]